MTGSEPSRYVSHGGEPSLSGAGLLELVRAITEQGLPLRMRAYGSSMTPSIRDGDLVTIVPLAEREPRVGEVIAFVSPRTEKLTVHRVVAREEDGWLLRGDNRRDSDGVVIAGGMLGSVARVERNGRDVDFGSGLKAEGIARLSRTGALVVLQDARRLARRAPARVLRCLQNLAWYRAAARSLALHFDVEAATGADAQAVRQLLAPGLPGIRPDILDPADISSWVARRKGKAIGFVQLVDVRGPDSAWTGAWLFSLAVEGRYRGLGVGVALERRAAEEARERGALRLSALVGGGDDRAVRFFRKLVFSPTVVESLEPGLAAQRELSGQSLLIMSKEVQEAGGRVSATPPKVGPGWLREAGLSQETRALLAVAWAVMDPEQLPVAHEAIAACTDADALCSKAVAHGMLGHLNRVVATPGGVATTPAVAGLAERLSEMQRALAKRGLRQTVQLLQLLDGLKAGGIDAMPYKGPAWGERFYGDLTLRTWSDLDVLVPRGQIRLARDVLLARGFVDGDDSNALLLAQRGRGWGQVALSARESDVELELHWQVTQGMSSKNMRAEALMARSEPLCLLGQKVRTPSVLDALLITCINGAKDRWETVESLLMAAVQIRAVGDTRWDEALEAAKEAGCLRRMIVAVSHVCRVFGAEEPGRVVAVVARDRAAQALLHSLTPGDLEHGKVLALEPELSVMSWRFASEDSRLAGLAHGAKRLLRPGPEDWTWVALPRGTWWLYRVLRPARLAAKWAKRL